MTILKFELKKLQKSIIVWSLVLSISIFAALPIYIQMFTSQEYIKIENFTDSRYFDALGTNIELLTTTIGAYSFLTAFVLLALAIHSMMIGLNLIIKEYNNKTIDFLMTKSFNRSSVLISKIIAVIISRFIITIFYFFASWIGLYLKVQNAFDLRLMTYIAFSTFLIQLLFVLIGVLIGVTFPQLKNTTAVAFGTTFLIYTTGSMANVTELTWLTYISPFLKFNGLDIIKYNGYNIIYLAIYILLITILASVSYLLFKDKDILLVS